MSYWTISNQDLLPMTAEIVNLKRARKAKARVEKERQAALNRAKYGQTKPERTATEAAKVKRDATLDGARLASDPVPANQGSFPATASHDGDDDLDPGNVS